MKCPLFKTALLAAVAAVFLASGIATAEEAAPATAATPSEQTGSSSSPTVIAGEEQESDQPEGESLINYHLPVDSLAVELYAGANFSITEPAPDVTTLSGFKGGAGVALSLIYRPDYFLSPFIEGSYYGLSSTTERSYDNAGKEYIGPKSLWMWGFGTGVLLDVWYLRGRFGITAQDYRMSTNINGVESRSSTLSYGYVFGLGGFFYRANGIQVGGEWRTIYSPTTNVSITFSVGLVASWDFLSL